MKVTIEIDCTPEEARRTMGLPDFAPIQERYVAELAAMTQGRIAPEAMDALLKTWNPLGERGIELWSALLKSGARSSD